LASELLVGLRRLVSERAKIRMSISQTTINEIKQLSVSEKFLIIDEIWDSITQENEFPELTKAQSDELSRRIDSYMPALLKEEHGKIKNDYWKSEET